MSVGDNPRQRIAFIVSLAIIGELLSMPRVKHVVLLKLRREMPAGTFEDVLRKLEALQRKLTGMLDLSGGLQSSREGFGQGFTHALAMTFADEATRDAYLVHPEHEVVKQILLSQLEGGISGVAVVDWLE
jgi:hypothetical protein